MRIEQTAVARVLPWGVAVVGAASLFSDRMWWWGTPMAAAVALATGAGALTGVISGTLAAKAYERTARAFKYCLMIAAVLFAVREHGQCVRDGLGLADECLVHGGPLALAAYASLRPAGRTGFALGAGLIAIASRYCDPVLPLLLLGFVLGRDVRSRETTSVRHALSLMGAGALAMLLVTTFDFDFDVLLRGRFVADTLMSRSYVDDGLTFVPRVVIEGTLIAACFAHLRGRTWGLLAIAVLAPLFIVLTKITPDLPWAGGGCITWPHPFEPGSAEVRVFEAAAMVTVLPWFGPVVRALRSPSSLSAAFGER